MPDNIATWSGNCMLAPSNQPCNPIKVTALERELRNGHSGCVMWLTGLPAAGKSSIGSELERELFVVRKQAYLLDGDNLRQRLCKDLRISPEDRRENTRRIWEVASLVADLGFVCIVAAISPYRAERALARRLALPKPFFEVFVNAPVAICESRDPKGLYAQARSGKIKEFTGVSAPYEPPLNPEIDLQTDKFTISESVGILVRHLELRCISKQSGQSAETVRSMVFGSDAKPVQRVGLLGGD